MKILLIAPPQTTRHPQPPLGLAMIAAVLKASSYDVEIIDLTLTKQVENMLSIAIRQNRPDIVGITAVTPLISSVANLARITKEVDASITVILGGPHASILPEATLRSIPHIDVIVRGEGEQTIIELVRTIEKNDSKNKILGITYREGSDIRSTPSRPPIQNLDQLPFPAFDLLPMDKYQLHPPFGRSFPCIPILTSRGCPYRCIFCSKSVFGRKFRANSPKYVADEIEYLIERFGVKEIKFYDDSFTLDRNRVINFCTELKHRGINILWTCETRVNLVDVELLKSMSDSGCYMIAYGVESGSQRILNNLKKDITLEQVTRAIRLTHQVGIQTVVYFMIGSPGETRKTMNRTIEFAKKLDPDFVTFSTATPYPGTELYDSFAKKGHPPKKWDELLYHWPGIVRLSGEDVGSWLRKAHLSFYLRRGYIRKRLGKTRSLGEIRTNIAGLRMLVDFIK